MDTLLAEMDSLISQIADVAKDLQVTASETADELELLSLPKLCKGRTQDT